MGHMRKSIWEIVMFELSLKGRVGDCCVNGEAGTFPPKGMHEPRGMEGRAWPKLDACEVEGLERDSAGKIG